MNNENQYLHLQLNCPNQIKCHKNHFLYLKLILLVSWDRSLNQAPIQKDRLKENWKTFRNRGLHFIHLSINSLLTRIYELMEIVKISNPGVIRITETKIDNSISDSKISFDGYYAVYRRTSDHQMIFCMRKINREKVGCHKQISFRSFKNYSVDEYEKALGKIFKLSDIS